MIPRALALLLTLIKRLWANKRQLAISAAKWFWNVYLPLWGIAARRIQSTMFPLALLLLASTAHAADCPGRHVLALIDATTPYDDQDRAQIMPAMERMGSQLRPGDRIHVVTVAEDAASSSLLFDRCMPGDNGTWHTWASWLLSDPERERLQFLGSIGRAIEPTLWQRHATPATALAKTLAAHAPADEVWMFTDLLDTAGMVDLPPMPDVTVHVAGVGRYHDSGRRPLIDAERERLIADWRGLLAGAGALLEVRP